MNGAFSRAHHPLQCLSVLHSAVHKSGLILDLDYVVRSDLSLSQNIQLECIYIIISNIYLKGSFENLPS